MTRLRVLFAEDDPTFREGMALLLAQQSGMDLVSVVTNGVEALEVASSTFIDVALLDVDMPVLDGIDTAKHIKRVAPTVTVVMLTAFEHDDSLKSAIAAGAQGFLTKDLPAARISELLHDAHNGAIVMGPKPTAMLAEAYHHSVAGDEGFAAAVEDLPPRLRAVLGLLIEAVPNRAIAAQLGLSEVTVRGYVSDILQATNSTSRSHVAVKALRVGLTL